MYMSRALKSQFLILKAKRSNLSSYSPTTGTRQMSPFSSPMSHSAQIPRKPPAEGKQNGRNSGEHCKHGFSVSGDMDNWNCFPFLHSRYREWELTMILIVVFQALEGSRELENIIGVSHSSCVLSAELQKTQAWTLKPQVLEFFLPNSGIHASHAVV
uniref:Integrin subunit beta 3 binding protein n=1 Tax=Corvus moneduloides TaxID=1196302 RepID=A0A8U7M2Q3_CORMO